MSEVHESQTSEATLLAVFHKIFGPDFVPPPRLPEAAEARSGISRAHAEVFNRPILDLKMRVVITFSVLVALGYKTEVKMYIQGLRNLGYSVRQIAEMILQVQIFSGSPRGVEANVVLKEVVDEEMERAKAKAPRTV